MPLTSSIIKTPHGFFTRKGGVSTGEYSSLNCSLNSGDDKEFVRQNRDIVRDHLNAKQLILASQIHSNIALHVKGEGAYECDALIADTPDIAIAILTADCSPILFHDASAGIIAAAHAGWKGARYGIIESTINKMREMGAKNITAAIGPTIAQNSYEVGADFIAAFNEESEANEQFFVPSIKPGHLLFDLPAYIHNKLKLADIAQIENLAEDTLMQPSKFYSHRRGTITGKAERSRQITAIILK